MTTNGTKLSLFKLILYIVLLLIIAGLGVALYCAVVFHEPVIDEPTINLENLINVDDENFVDENYSIVINDDQYDLYCKLDFNKAEKEGLSFGEPIAYTFNKGQHYYSYYVQIFGLPEGDWIASFKEDGSKGIITNKNCEYIWKRSDAAIPGWLQLP